LKDLLARLEKEEQRVRYIQAIAEKKEKVRQRLAELDGP
jgi:hypothetical protein